MKDRLSLTLLFACLMAFGLNSIEAQTKTDKKVVIVKKVVDADGKETVERIEATGEEADKYLEELKKEEAEDGTEIDIDVEVTAGADGEMIEKKIYKLKVADENGNVKVLEWDGTGEMPSEMKTLMDEHDIDVIINVDEEGKLHEGHGHSSSVKVSKDHEHKMIRINKEGDKKQEEKIVTIIDENPNKVQLGIMIENNANGIKVNGFAPNNKAKDGGMQEGDIIYNFNGVDVKSIEDLISEVGKYNPGDKVNIKAYRYDGMTSYDIILTERTGTSKKKFKWKEIERQ